MKLSKAIMLAGRLWSGIDVKNVKLFFYMLGSMREVLECGANRHVDIMRLVGMVLVLLVPLVLDEPLFFESW